MHLVGFTIEMYYDARSYRGQRVLALPFHVSAHVGHSSGNTLNIWQGTVAVTVLVTERCHVLRHQTLIENTVYYLCLYLKTLRKGDADLRFYITIVQDG